MPKTDNFPTPNTQIQTESLSIDKMRLTVTNIYPTFQKKTKQQTKQEIEVLLYQIFQKYADV